MNPIAALLLGPWANLGLYQPVDKLLQTALHQTLSDFRRHRDADGNVIAYGTNDNEEDDPDQPSASDDRDADYDADPDDDDMPIQQRHPADKGDRPARKPDTETKAMKAIILNALSRARAIVKNANASSKTIDTDAHCAAISKSLLKPLPYEARPAPPIINVVHTEPGDDRREARRAINAFIRHRKNETGIDRLGFSYRMLATIVNTPGNPDCPNHDHLLTILDAARGNLFTHSALHDACTLRGIVIPKPDGSGRVLGIAPIFLRLAASLDCSALLKNMDTAAKDALIGANQFAVGNASGATGPPILMQALYDGGKIADIAGQDGDSQSQTEPSQPAKPTMVMIGFDIESAYYSMHQHIIREVITRKCPTLTYHLNTFYGNTPVDIAFHDRNDSAKCKRASVQRGVIPGDPIGTLAMSVVLNDKVTPELLSEFPDVVLAIFADDHTGWIPLDRLEAFVTRMGELLAPTGCKLNATKSKAMLCGGTPEDAARFRAICDKLHIAACDDGMIICGVPVGKRDFVARWADDLATKVAKEQRALIAVLDEHKFNDIPRFQAGYAAMRFTGSSSFTWAARAIHPAIMQPAAVRLDAELRDIFYDLLNLHGAWAALADADRHYADTRLSLAKSWGGAALSRCKPMLTGAFLGGVADLAQTLRRSEPSFELAVLLPSAEALYTEVCELAKTAHPGASITSYTSFAALTAARRGKAISYNVNRIYDRSAFNDLIDTHGVSPRSAHLNASRGKAQSALDGAPRFLSTRLDNATFRCGIASILGLPLAADVLEQCPCGAPNPATGEHAYICSRDTSKQLQATDGQVAAGLVVANLRSLKLMGKRMTGINRRPDEVTFAQARDAVGLELAKPSDADRRFDLGFTTPDATPIYVDAKRTAVVHANNLQKVCDLKKGQRHAVEAGDKAKSYSYQKAISNFDDKRRHIFLATTDTCGNLSDDYTRLLRFVARIHYPGAGVKGDYDVDGLRSQAVAFARRTVGAGVWRANFKTIYAWAHRTRAAAAHD